MALNIWTQPSGYSFGTLQEQATVNISLPISLVGNLTFNVVYIDSIELDPINRGSWDPFYGKIIYETYISEELSQQLLTNFEIVINGRIGYTGSDTILPVSTTTVEIVANDHRGNTINIPKGTQYWAVNFPEVNSVVVEFRQPDGVAWPIFYHAVDIPHLVTWKTAAFLSVNYKIISGALPLGLYLEDATIVGAPLAVPNQTIYTFCIRASNGVNISDRTFTVNVFGYNPPTFITPSGELALGPNQQYYTPDQTYINFQLEVTDINVASGAILTYYIADGDGKLPPGLTLSSSGLISGYIEPAPSITVNDGVGNFDEQGYDGGVFDFGLRATNGFDSYQYDDVIFDYFVPTVVIQTLSLNYQFKVTVTDGINYTQRVFKIFVTGSDEFRADSTTLDGQADQFTADSTYLRRPVWLTDSNLGVYRSNNYVTIPVALYDNNNVEFRLEITNKEVYALAYQILITDNIVGSTSITIHNPSVVPTVGLYFTLNNYVTGADETLYTIKTVTQLSPTRFRLELTTALSISIPNNTQIYVGSLSKLPTGLSFDPISGDLYGLVPYQPNVTQLYTFTITATRPGDNNNEFTSASRQFTMVILGSINSTITWVSPTNLGIIPADFVSTINLIATTNVPDAVITYNLVAGSLPPGLKLSGDGELLGVPNQFYDMVNDQPGLITLETGTTTFDQNATTFDRLYTFTIEAADQYSYSAIDKKFTLTISTPNTKVYNNIVARPFLIPAQRKTFSNFINNATIFTPSSIYRPQDSNFGVQTNLTMLVYAGIENTNAAAYVSAMTLNNKKKRFQFGSIQKSIAYDPVTNNSIYEVVYIQMLDPLEPNGKHLPLSIKSKFNESETITVDNTINYYKNDTISLNASAPVSIKPDYFITVDSTGYEVNTPNTNTYFPSSISNWQDRISSVGATERDYLPLWMRSIQSGQKSQLGYVLSLPLCFCKPGTADKIITNIKFSGFDFSHIDYTIDRFILTSLSGYSNDKYLVFKDNRITV